MPIHQKTRRVRLKQKNKSLGVAVFNTPQVKGEAVFEDEHRGIDKRSGVKLTIFFTALPKGKHGFHIHTAGDLRGEGCKGACAHYHTGPHQDHGPAPAPGSNKTRKQRHTGDLGNIHLPAKNKPLRKTYHIQNTSVKDLWGRSLIVHADEDDLGRGPHEDSKTTGHSGTRIACAIIGRGTTKCM
jgi:Cu-Zn family superoxide dismutase